MPRPRSRCCPKCCRRRCSAIGAAAACSIRAIPSASRYPLAANCGARLTPCWPAAPGFSTRCGNGAWTRNCRSCESTPIPMNLGDCKSPRSRWLATRQRQAKLHDRLAKLGPQLAFLEAIRAELPEDGIYVDEVTQIGFVARLAFPVYSPRTFLSPGYQDNLGWGYATALGVQHARPDVPVLSINGDGGFLYTSNELATAIRHRIPLVAVVFVDGAFGNVRRIQQEQFGDRLIASDLANPDFVKYAESFGAAGCRARGPDELRVALREAFARREPSLIEVPVGSLPSPWEFIHMPRVRGK